MKSYYPVPQSATPLSCIATITPLSCADIAPGIKGQIKEWLDQRIIDLCANGGLGARPLKMKLGSCRQLCTPFITLYMSSSLKRDFGFLKKTMHHKRLQYHNALLAYNLWTKGMLLRCLRIPEKNNLMSMRQILMTKNQILKNIQSLSKNMCYPIRQSSTCSCICASRHVTVRGNNSCKTIKDPLNGTDR